MPYPRSKQKNTANIIKKYRCFIVNFFFTKAHSGSTLSASDGSPWRPRYCYQLDWLRCTLHFHASSPSVSESRISGTISEANIWRSISVVTFRALSSNFDLAEQLVQLNFDLSSMCFVQTW